MEPGDVRSKGGFPATRHSVIERIRDADPDARRDAFGDLVEGYWKPVYKHLRLTWRLDRRGRARLHPGVLRRCVSEGVARALRAGESAVPHVRARLRRSLRDEHAPVGVATETRRRRPAAVARFRRRRTRSWRSGRLRRDARSRRALPSGVHPRAVREGGRRAPRRVRGRAAGRCPSHSSSATTWPRWRGTATRRLRASSSSRRRR